MTVDTYIKNKDIANKEKTRKVLYFSAIFILSRLYNSGLEFSKIIRPSNDTEQIFLSFYLLHLFEIINLTHPENFTYNDIIYTYLFNETKFTEKYPEIYIIENVNTPYESIVKLSAMQTLEYMKKYIVTITGDCFVKHDQQIGLFTNMLEEFSKKRKIFQSKMEQYPKGSVEYQLYNNRQNATKIVMNSNYGVQGLKSFRYSNSHLAQCITTQGRLTIKLAQYVSDKYLDSKMSKRKYKLKRYNDYCLNGDNNLDLKFFEYTIVVPTKQDKKELLEASQYLHDLRCIDTEYIVINQLVHEYEHKTLNVHSNIIVDKELYKKLNS